MRKRFLAVVMSAVLAVSLCPGLAIALPLTGASADLAGQPAKTARSTKVTQAKKTKVYVLVGTGDDETEEYTYKNGLLVSYGNYNFKYKGINLKSIRSTYGGSSEKLSVKSKKGMPVSASAKYDSSRYEYKFSRNAKGNLTSLKEIYYSKNYSGKTFKKAKKIRTSTTNFKLDKKGRISSSSSTTSYIDKSGRWDPPYKYKYDKRGNLTKMTYPYQYSTSSVKYSYTKGHAKSRTRTYKYSDGEKSTYTTTLRFRLVTVPSKNLPVVKAQQWALLNGNLNKAFGPFNPGS